MDLFNLLVLGEPDQQSATTAPPPPPDEDEVAPWDDDGVTLSHHLDPIAEEPPPGEPLNECEDPTSDNLVCDDTLVPHPDDAAPEPAPRLIHYREDAEPDRVEPPPRTGTPDRPDSPVRDDEAEEHEDRSVIIRFGSLFRTPSFTAPNADLLPGVLAEVRRRDWRIFTDGRLNIVGCRSRSRRPERFDDLLTVHYVQGGRWRSHAWPATTDPGFYWLRHPMRAEGTAILAEGQYIDAYRIGRHKGQYEALVQEGPVRVFRDADRDTELDPRGFPLPGLYGINIHRASSSSTSHVVEKWSAGCQVIADPADFEHFMHLCRQQRDRISPKFTYSLLTWPA